MSTWKIVNFQQVNAGWVTIYNFFYITYFHQRLKEVQETLNDTSQNAAPFEIVVVCG